MKLNTAKAIASVAVCALIGTAVYVTKSDAPLGIALAGLIVIWVFG